MPNTSTTKQDRKVKKARTLDTNKASNDGAENKENIDFAKVSQNTTQNADNNNSKDLNIKQVVTDTRTESETTKETTVAREKNTSLAPQDNMRQNLAKQTEHVADNNHVSDQQAEPEGHVTDNGHEMDLADDQSKSHNIATRTRQWSDLFAKLERGKATYSTYSPRKRLHTKNENALIFEIHNLENISTAEIVEAMQNKMGKDLIAVKPIIIKNKRSH